MVEIEKLAEKLGEAMGLEMAAQKAEELSLQGLLREDRMIGRLQKLYLQARNHQSKLKKVVKNTPKLNGSKLDFTKIQQVAYETADRCSNIMHTYLGEDPDSSEAIEFLCLAEAGEVTHYKVLAAMTKGLKGKKNSGQLLTTVNSIVREEKRHLRLYTRFAKQIASE